MAPNPIAETSRPLRPNFRFCISMLSRYPLRSSNHSKQLSEIGAVDLPENGSHADKVCLSVADARCAGDCCQCVGSTRIFPAARRPLHECDTESLLEPTQRLTHPRPAHAEPLSRGAESPGLRYRDEHRHPVQIIHH